MPAQRSAHAQGEAAAQPTTGVALPHFDQVGVVQRTAREIPWTAIRRTPLPGSSTPVVQRRPLPSGGRTQPSRRRPLPAGAPLFELSIDSSAVIGSFDKLWKEDFGPYGNPLRFDVPDSFSQHPELPGLIREVCGGSHFRGNNYWSSNWLDDGDTELLWAGDADVKAEMSIYIQDEQETGRGAGEFSSSSSSSHSQTQSSSTTTSGSMTGSVGGHEGRPGGQANVGTSSTAESSSTMTSTGQGGLSMTGPARRIRASVVMEIRLTFRPSILGPAPETRTIFTPVVGTVLMGAPAE